MVYVKLKPYSIIFEAKRNLPNQWAKPKRPPKSMSLNTVDDEWESTKKFNELLELLSRNRKSLLQEFKKKSNMDGELTVNKAKEIINSFLIPENA